MHFDPPPRSPETSGSVLSDGLKAALPKNCVPWENMTYASVIIILIKLYVLICKDKSKTAAAMENFSKEMIETCNHQDNIAIRTLFFTEFGNFTTDMPDFFTFLLDVSLHFRGNEDHAWFVSLTDDYANFIRLFDD